MRISLRRRVAQMTEWLRRNHPTPYPVVVRWTPKVASDPGDPPETRKIGDFAECYWQRPNIVIRLSSRRCRAFSAASETLLHEWAHAQTMPNERVSRHPARSHEEHPDEWALAYGKLYRAWVDDGGCVESRRIEI